MKRETEATRSQMGRYLRHVQTYSFASVVRVCNIW